MAWATIFWENVCQKYELVINADGSSYVFSKIYFEYLYL